MPISQLSYDSKEVVPQLQNLASPEGPKGTLGLGIRQAIDWNDIEESKRLLFIKAIDSGAGKYDTDRLFWLLWSAARLDINLFAEPFKQGDKLLENLEDNDFINKSLGKPNETNLKAQHFPKVIGALAIFLRKYAEDNPDLEIKLLKHLQNRITVLARKISELEARPNDIFHLQQTKQLLRSYQERMSWPDELNKVLKANNYPSDDKKSLLEIDAYKALKKHCPELRFEKHYFIPEISHTVDIAIPEKKIAIEVDGPGHFYMTRKADEQGKVSYESSKKYDTKTWARNKMLEDQDWTVVSITYYEWNAVKQTKKVSADGWVTPNAIDIAENNYLRGKLEKWLTPSSLDTAIANEPKKPTFGM